MVQTDLVNFILWMRKCKLNTFSNWLELNNIVKQELGPEMSIRHLCKANKAVGGNPYFLMLIKNFNETFLYMSDKDEQGLQ
jgi:hypothetical protein